jgi:hypothetical protein
LRAVFLALGRIHLVQGAVHVCRFKTLEGIQGEFNRHARPLDVKDWRAMPAAVATFSESTPAAMGIRTGRSAAARERG